MDQRNAWQRHSRSKGQTQQENTDDQALREGIEASLQFATGNCLASATGSSSSSSRPSQTVGPEIAAGNCSASAPNSDEMPDVPGELTESMKAANLDIFARTALESLHLGSIFYKECNQKKAALGRVPPEMSTSLTACSLIYEKFFVERKSSGQILKLL